MRNSIHIFSPSTDQVLSSFNTLEDAIKHAKETLKRSHKIVPLQPHGFYSFEIGTVKENTAIKDKVLRKVAINHKSEIEIFTIK